MSFLIRSLFIVDVGEAIVIYLLPMNRVLKLGGLDFLQKALLHVVVAIVGIFLFCEETFVVRDRVVNALNEHSLCENAEDVERDESLTPDSLVDPLVALAYTGQVARIVEHGAPQDLHDNVVDGDEGLEPEVPLHHALEDSLQLLCVKLMGFAILVLVSGSEDVKSCVPCDFGILSLPGEIIAQVVHHELVASVDEEEEPSPVHHVGVGLAILANGTQPEHADEKYTRIQGNHDPHVDVGVLLQSVALFSGYVAEDGHHAGEVEEIGDQNEAEEGCNDLGC